ncbi:COX15/CtaA family protein [Salinibacterium sp.]|uniref:COX15/CtaA family protein n=1 Tax=Salinibacterium sp. TaxID=1915057 RepID=UPI00286D0116|nr:COX15/CtaA family protein [Salinibacterium sp.]
MVTGLIDRLPTGVDRRVRVTAWLSLAFQLALIGTGGAVRLTASGLGCPTWPQCTDGSFVNTPEMGIHGFIEFGNRLLTFVLAAITIAAFLSVIRFRRQRRDLFRLTLLQGLSIPFQAVLGGITVLTGLNPYVVGAHFAVSVVLVSVTSTLVWRVYNGARGGELLVPPRVVVLGRLTAASVAVTVAVGILTTGSGPHAGDNSNPDEPAPRNGLDPAFLQHVHSWPAYVTVGLSVLLAVVIIRFPIERRWIFALLLIEAVQVIVGVAQARLGLPEVLVGIHMILAGALAASMTVVLLSLRATPTAPPPHTEVEAERVFV